MLIKTEKAQLCVLPWGEGSVLRPLHAPLVDMDAQARISARVFLGTSILESRACCHFRYVHSAQAPRSNPTLIG